LPATEPVHDRAEVPDPPAIEVADRVQDRFVELVVTPRITVPAKPLTGATVIVEVPPTPVLTVTLEALAVTVKFWTWNVTVAEWDSVPLVPVIVAR
jgi:hypothetical protein